VKKTSKLESQTQSTRFIDAARKLGCDEDPANFEEKLKKVAAHKPPTPKNARDSEPAK